MQYRYVALLFVACTFATLSPLWTHAQGLPTVIISEISWGGSSLSTADEWIELANTSSAPVDIGGWMLDGILSSGSLVIPLETVIEPYETYLIANYAMGNEKSVLTVEPHMVTSSVSIPNSDLAVVLTNSAGEVIDSYIDAGTPDFGSTSPHGTIERNLADDTWFTSTPGTPGSVTITALEVIASYEDSGSQTEIVIENVAILPETTHNAEVGSESSLEIVVIEETPAYSLDSEADDSVEVMSETVSSPETEIITLIAPITSETVTTASEETLLEETSSPQTSSEAPEDETSYGSSSTSVTIDYSYLHVTEFLSSPTEGSEWIELWNSGDGSLSLDGVTIEDASGKVTLLSGTLDAHSYLLVEDPSGNLNNTGDTITLRLPDGQILITITYGTATFAAPKKDASAGVCSDGWHTSLSPSPAQENPCPTTILEFSSYDQSTTSTGIYGNAATSGDSSTTEGNLSREEGAGSSGTSIASVATSLITEGRSSSDNAITVSEFSETEMHSSPAKKASSKNTVLSVTLSELDTLPSGQHVQITDVLAVAPGIFGKRIAYLHGVQLYFHAAEWPELAPGTLVQVTGVWDVDADSRRIKLSRAADIVVLGTSTLTPLSLLDIPEPSVGDLLATASGILLRKDGNIFVFSTNEGKEFHVQDIAKTGALSNLRAGDIATVVGMLLARDGMWILAPRTNSDVTVTAETGLTPVSTPPSHTSTLSSSPSHAPLIGGGILASSISALGYWFVRSRKFSLLFSS